MISYMYTFDYKDEQHQDPEECNSLSRDQAMKIVLEERPNTPMPVPVPVADDPDNSLSGREEHQPTLFSSVRVYAIAEKYTIPALKELARCRFCDWADHNWSCADFHNVAREIFDSTPSHDRGLRGVVVRIVAKHVYALVEDDNVRQLVEDTGDLGWNVIRQLLKIHSEEKSQLRSQIEILEAENALLKERLNGAKLSLSWKTEDMDLIISKVNGVAECRNCRKGFNVEIDSNMYGARTVRCQSCRCKH